MEEGVGRTGQGCVIVFSISSRADWGPPGGALVRPLHPGREQSREPIFLPPSSTRDHSLLEKQQQKGPSPARLLPNGLLENCGSLAVRPESSEDSWPNQMPLFARPTRSTTGGPLLPWPWIGRRRGRGGACRLVRSSIPSDRLAWPDVPPRVSIQTPCAVRPNTHPQVLCPRVIPRKR